MICGGGWLSGNERDGVDLHLLEEVIFETIHLAEKISFNKKKGTPPTNYRWSLSFDLGKIPLHRASHQRRKDLRCKDNSKVVT